MPSSTSRNEEILVEFHRRLDQFLKTRKITKKALAEAMGIPPQHLTLGHQIRPQSGRSVLKILCDRFMPGGIRHVAERFNLPREGYAELERLAELLYEATYGWTIETFRNHPEKGHLSRIADLGYIGAHLYHQGQWDAALPYLENAWLALRPHLSLSDDLALHVGLFTAANLLDWAVLARRYDRIRPYKCRRVLRDMCPDYSGSNRRVFFAMSGFYLASASLSAHLNEPNEITIKECERAYDHSQKNGWLTSQSNALRDGARGYFRKGMGIGKSLGPSDPGDLEKAFRLLVKSETAVGGLKCEGLHRLPWTYTRLRRITYLAGAERDDESYRLWEEMNEVPWFPSLCEENPYLALKAETAEMTARLTRGDLAGMASVADRILADPRYPSMEAPYRRVEMLRSRLKEENRSELRKLLYLDVQ